VISNFEITPREVAVDRIRAYVAERREQHEAELAEWIAVPSVSATGEGMAAATEYAVGLVRRSGLTPQVVDTGGWPLVTGHAAGPPGGPHVVIYGHYDVQPPGPIDEWHSPPFRATVRDGRVYGRGTGDNKGQHLAQLLALRALNETGRELPCTVTVLLDGEEEIGSPNLAATLGRMREDLDADLVVWSDGPVHDSGEPTVVLGVRGIVSFEIVVRGASAPLHSGNWGGVAPNPAWELVWLLATIRTPDGRIAIDGHDAGAVPLDPAERRALEALPVDMDAVLAGAGLDRLDAPADRPFSERLTLPTFTINSLTCLDGGDHRTVIPATAVARCDMRLVGGQRGETAIAALRAHLARHLPHAELRLTRGVMEASRTPLDSAYTDVIMDGLTEAYGRPPLVVPALGGSLPIAALSEGLGLPCYGVPLANADERNHAPNENIELDRFHDGIVACAGVLTALGAKGVDR
jgi:acetylornithine deacetylase/succinyl-diaminopimelate desuccinylase-like protein